MDNENFKIRIVDLYKGMEEPIINNLYKDEKTQDITCCPEIPDKNIFAS
jgi:hypothetical protein